ncbi:MAG: PAS domain S-box protein, partial [Bacteroidales bacterium]|nr:PAS domain S-box protein [Bacteroidales bacterium]
MSNIAHELFLLAVNLSQYKSKTLIVKVFVEGINTIFNPHTFEWSEEKTEDNETIFDVCTRTKKYGHIKHNKKGNFTNEAFSLLQNVVQMIAVLLEKLEHEEFFNNQKEHLQQLVDKQTSDLLQRQTELQTQNEEYEALNEELRQTNDELNQLTFALQIAKEKAENNENILKEAQSLAHIGNWMLDLNQNILSWSDEIYRIFGCKPQEFGATYEAFLNFIHPDDRDFVNNAYLNHINSKKPYNIVHRILLASGEVKYVNERCKTDFDEQGKAIRSVGTVSDITEKKIAENALQRTQYSIDNITDSIFWIDESARLIYVNQAACRNLEYSIDNLLQLTIFDIDPSFPKNKWNEHWQEILLRGSFTIETIHRTNSGKQYPVEVTTNKVEFGGVQYNCAIARDITERKIAEQELINAIQKTETSEQRLFTFINSVPDIICYKDGEGKWLLANEADLELFCL